MKVEGPKNMNETMNKTDYRSLMNKPFLGSWDVPAGQTVTVTVTNVTRQEVVGDGGKKSQCIVATLRECKPMILNSTNCKTLTKLFQSPYIEDWRGQILLGVDKVRFGGDTVDGLRVKPYLPRVQQDAPVACADCGIVIEGAAGKTAEQVASSTQRRYGRCLCASCASKEQARRKARAADTTEGQLADLIGGQS